MLQQKMVFPSVDYFRLVESPYDHEGVFLRIEDDDAWTYCDLPSGFHIQCVRVLPDNPCPHADDHALYDMLHELSQLSRSRHASLARLFETLSTEEGARSVHRCGFCRRRAESVDSVVKLFEKPYPFLTRSTIDLFYRYPVRDPASLENLLKPHVASMHYLFSQIRNPAIRETLVEGVYDAVLQLEDEVEDAVQRHDDDTMRAATKRFKSMILDTIDRCCPFVNVRKIEFQRWLLTLVYFGSLQQPEPLHHHAALRLVKKTILLLHLYFHTPTPLTPDSVLYLEKGDDTPALRIATDWESLNRIHPAMRGECLRV